MCNCVKDKADKKTQEKQDSTNEVKLSCET